MSVGAGMLHFPQGLAAGLNQPQPGWLGKCTGLGIKQC